MSQNKYGVKVFNISHLKGEKFAKPNLMCIALLCTYPCEVGLYEIDFVAF